MADGKNRSYEDTKLRNIIALVLTAQCLVTNYEPSAMS